MVNWRNFCCMSYVVELTDMKSGRGNYMFMSVKSFFQFWLTNEKESVMDNAFLIPGKAISKIFIYLQTSVIVIVMLNI